ncbi:MAG: peptidyl-prolyl cis-trans isomerase, partial [Gemmatimonadales bacterium]
RIKLIQQVTAGVQVSDVELWQQWRDRHDSVTAELVTLYPALAIPDSAVNLSEANLRNWYQANRERLRRAARASMSYIAVSRTPNAADTAAAAVRAADVHAQLVAGADFAEMAGNVSSDSLSGAQGGDLGEQRRGVFVAEFEAAALALRPGQLSAPVWSPFGWHIIRLDARTDTTFHAAHILIPVEPTGDHLDLIERQADSLDILAAEQDDGSALDRVAQALRTAVLVAPPVHQGQRLDLHGEYLGDPSVWAFGPDGIVGGTSPVIETDAAYYVFRLDTLHTEGVPPFAAVTEDVRRAAMLEAKRTLTRQAAASLATRARGAGGLLDQVGDLLAVPSTVGPFPRVSPPPVLQGAPDVVGVAFGLGVGQISDPIVTETALYVLRVTRKVLADSTAWRAQLDVQRAQALQQARQIRVQAVFASLRQAARVEDYRDELARLAREQEDAGGMPGNPFGF